MKRNFTLLLLCLIFSEGVQSQSIAYLKKNQKYTHHLTQEISAEDEMARVDSFCAGLVARLDSFTQTTIDEPRNKKVFYYHGDTLLLLKNYMEDSTTTNRAEWYFERNTLVCMKHYVRYKDSGKYFTRDRYYFSPLISNRLYAWIKFDRHVEDGCDAWDHIDLSLSINMHMDDFKKLKK